MGEISLFSVKRAAVASERSGRALIFLCQLLLAAGGVYHIIGLYADGSQFLHCLLNKAAFCLGDKPRAHANIVTQAPLVAALKLGVVNLNVLMRIHTAGLIVIPLTLWAAALALHRKSPYFWLIVSSFAAVYLNTGFFAISEYNLTFGIVALGVAILIQQKPVSKTDSIVLLVMGAMLLRAYEAVVLFGVLLSVMSFIRLYLDWCNPGDKWNRLLLAAAAIIFLCGSIASLYFIVIPDDPLRDAGSLLSLSQIRFFSFNYQFICTLLMLMLFSTTLLPLASHGRWLCIGLSVILGIIFLATPSLWAKPYMHYENRVTMFAVAALTLTLPFLVFILDYKAVLLRRKNGGGAFLLKLAPGGHLIVLMLTAMLCVPFFAHQRGFFLWLTEFEQTVNAGSGLIPLEEVLLAENPLNSLYGWSWTYPVISIVIRKNADAIILNNPANYDGWQPFDPLTHNDSFMRRYIKEPF